MFSFDPRKPWSEQTPQALPSVTETGLEFSPVPGLQTGSSCSARARKISMGFLPTHSDPSVHATVRCGLPLVLAER